MKIQNNSNKSRPGDIFIQTNTVMQHQFEQNKLVKEFVALSLLLRGSVDRGSWVLGCGFEGIVIKLVQRKY